jgi:hypothetical protein
VHTSATIQQRRELPHRVPPARCQRAKGGPPALELARGPCWAGPTSRPHGRPSTRHRGLDSLAAAGPPHVRKPSGSHASPTAGRTRKMLRISSETDSGTDRPMGVVVGSLDGLGMCWRVVIARARWDEWGIVEEELLNSMRISWCRIFGAGIIRWIICISLQSSNPQLMSITRGGISTHRDTPSRRRRRRQRKLGSGCMTANVCMYGDQRCASRPWRGQQANGRPTCDGGP